VNDEPQNPFCTGLGGQAEPSGTRCDELKESRSGDIRGDVPWSRIEGDRSGILERDHFDF
jgi:hypothetical protein